MTIAAIQGGVPSAKVFLGQLLCVGDHSFRAAGLHGNAYMSYILNDLPCEGAD
jgi:hypothetical protein